VTVAIRVVTGQGISLNESDLDRIVVRRREAEFDPGSEIAICAHHGPLLIQTQACQLRMTEGALSRVVKVDAGVLEVLDDVVTLVVT
jgi:F0F1-type ATP synthase epsilon subunit